VLILIVMFAPRGILGMGQSVRGLWRRPSSAPAATAPSREATRG